ncbi:MAG: FitA-like ribbon-helix-helix domain-containing protein [Thermodesulfobacteriota bacterium]
MANLQIKNMDDDLYARLKEIARGENRSISQEALFVLQSYIKIREKNPKDRTHAQALLELAGSWEDDRDADDIIQDIRDARKNSQRYENG